LSCSPKELQGFKDNVLIETYQPQSERMDEGLKVGVGVLEINKEEEREISKMAPIFKEVTQQKEIQKIRQIEKVRTEPIQKVFTQQAIKTRQPQVLVIPTPQPQKPKPSKPPRKRTKIIPPKFDDPLKRRKKPLPKKKRPEEFLAITKRYGKERVIARGTDLGKIIGAGKRQVKETLGATLKVKTARGKQIQLTPTKGFRPGKRDPLSIVQVKEGRLGTLGERREIKRARGVLAI
jgi:hypothetical protein